MRAIRILCVFLLLATLCVAQTPASRASAALVTIRGTAENGGQVSGSGFLVASNGTIVTNLHLVQGLSKAHVELASGDVFDAFTIVSSDARRDLAIIRIAGFDLPHLVLGNSNTVHTGDTVQLVSPTGSVSNASVTGVTAANGFRLIETSAAADAVSSGDVLLSANGEAIGILGYHGAASSAVAVPINYARGLLDNSADVVAEAQPAAPARPAKPAHAPQAAPPVEASAAPAPTPSAPVAPAEPAETAAVTPAPPPQPMPAAPAVAPEPAPPAAAPAYTTADRGTSASSVTPQPAPAPTRDTRATETARPAVRKIYIGSLGSGEGPDMLRDKIAHHLQENNFEVVDSPDKADAVFSGTGKWDHVRVQQFSARLVTGDERVLWSGEVSSGGWIRSASTSVANKLVDQMIRGLVNGGPR